MTKFGFGGNDTVFEEFPGIAGFFMGKISEAGKESSDEEPVRFLCFFRSAAGDVELEDFCILEWLGGDV